MSPPAPSFLRRHGFALVFAALLVAALFVYARYSQRYVGAVDWYGYYQEALLFKAGRVSLPTELPAQDFPAIVPLGFNVLADGRAVSQYPPGFPLLLAGGAVFGLEFWVLPLVGVASVLVLFLLVRDVTGDRLTAALYAWLWALFPIVVYGSTFVMSDLVAAFFVMTSYWLYRRGSLWWSACALTYALAVRPTNALYVAVFALLLLRDRKLIRYALYMLLPGALYGWYNYRLFGAPWRTGYEEIGYDLTAEFFWHHLGYFLWQTLLQLSPVVLLLAAGDWRKPRTEKIFFAAWCAVFLLFYCCWRPGANSWWWTRFLLPGFAPLFLLSALGFHRVREWLAAKWPDGPRRSTAQIALFVLLGVTPVYYVWFGFAHHDLWSTQKGYTYLEVAQEVERQVPPGSYVGSIELAGSFRLYTQLGSYNSVHGGASALINYLLAHGRNVYLLVEPWNQAHSALLKLREKHAAVKVHEVNAWGGLTLYRLTMPAQP